MNDTKRRRRPLISALAAVTIASTTFLGGAATAVAAPSVNAAARTGVAAAVPSGNAAVALYTGMQKLWGDHMYLTFATVDAFFHEPDELTANLTRLLQNQTDIGNAIKPVYGAAAGTELSTLLHAHINGYVPLLKDVKAGNTAAANKDFAAILANGVTIGKFLEKANPTNWPAPMMEDMMTAHNNQTKTYAVDLFKGDYTASITDFDTALNHMMDMSNTLSAGVIAQFPVKFAAAPVGGVATGAGDTAGAEDIDLFVFGGVLLLAAAAAGAFGFGRRRQFVN
jgi:hypothetical protein